MAKEGQIKAGKLAGLSLPMAIWVVAWPVVSEILLNATVGLVDVMIAANLSTAATDGVGAAAYILWFNNLITTAIGTGATALISRALGAGRVAAANAALGQSVLLASIMGLLMAGFFALIAPGISAILLSANPAAQAEFTRYLRALCIGMPLSTVMLASIAALRGSGDTLRALLVMCVVNVVNMFVAWFLAGGDITMAAADGARTVLIPHPLPPEMHKGTLGIGLGTSIAQGVGCILVLWMLLHRPDPRHPLRLFAHRLKYHAVTCYRLLRLGMPNFFEMFGMWVGNMLVLVMVSQLTIAAMGAPEGTNGGVVGAHLIAIRIESFSFGPGFALGIAAAALAGQFLGAGSPQRARQSVEICAMIAAAFMGVVGLVFVFAGRFLAEIVSRQEVHREIVPQLLFITGMVQAPFAVSIVLRSAMNGVGDTKVVMRLTWLSTWGLRLPLAYLISGVDLHVPALLGHEPFVIHNPSPFHLGIRGLWIGLCSEIIIRLALYGTRFLHGGWLKQRK